MSEDREILYCGDIERRVVKMESSHSILMTVRKALGLGESDTTFDEEILLHINSSIGKLSQNGAVKNIFVSGEDSLWDSLLHDHDSMGMITSFIFLNVKVLFDPPPPSTIQYYNSQIEELLWRLKVSYEKLVIKNESR